MNLHRLTPWLLLAALGCAGTETDVSSSGSFALDAAPLPSIPAELWQPARAGCEGALEAATSFGIADRAPDLVVALGAEGVVCVDTYSAVESELTVVDPDAIDSLWLGYMASLQEVDPADDGRRTVQFAEAPHPRIYELTAPAQAEPQPQPSHPTPPIDQAPAEAEPQPQPSDPGPDTADAQRDTGAKEPGLDMSDELDCEPPSDPVTPTVR